MKINHIILEKLYQFFGNSLSNRLQFRILNIHDILEKDFDHLEKTLLTLKKNWEFIDPSTLHMMNKKINKNCILLTFDDGYKSQKIFADKILNNHKDDAKKFVLKNIDKNIYKNQLRYDEVDNMNFEDLLKLKSDNHLIGSHTVNHKKLTNINNLEELKFEIYDSKKKLENILKCKIDNFAYTYGDINSINQQVLNNLRKYYKNIFSGIRGNNFSFNSKTIFLRDELSPSYSSELINSFLFGYSDLYYYKKQKQIINMEKNV